MDYFGCLGRGWECRSCCASVVTVSREPVLCDFSSARFFFLRAAAAEPECGLTLLRAAVQLWHNFLCALGCSIKSSHRFFHGAFNALRTVRCVTPQLCLLLELLHGLAVIFLTVADMPLLVVWLKLLHLSGFCPCNK